MGFPSSPSRKAWDEKTQLNNPSNWPSWACEGEGIQTLLSSFPNGSAMGIDHNTQALIDEH